MNSGVMKPLLPSVGVLRSKAHHRLLLPFVDSGDGVDKRQISPFRDYYVEQVALLVWRIPDVEVKDCLWVLDLASIQSLTVQPRPDGLAGFLRFHGLCRRPSYLSTLSLERVLASNSTMRAPSAEEDSFALLQE